MKTLLVLTLLAALMWQVNSQQCTLCRETTTSLEYELIQYIENSMFSGPELTQAINTWLLENVCSNMLFTSEQCIGNINTLITSSEQNGMSSLSVIPEICEYFKMC